MLRNWSQGLTFSYLVVALQGVVGLEIFYRAALNPNQIEFTSTFASVANETFFFVPKNRLSNIFTRRLIARDVTTSSISHITETGSL